MPNLATKPLMIQLFTNRTLVTPLILLGCLLAPAAVTGGELESYSKNTEPGFSLTDLNERTHALSDYTGKVVLVNFWATWCPPCIREMPELQKLKKHFADRPFEVVTINVAEPKDRVSKLSRSIKLDLPVLLDTAGKTYHRWEVSILPTSFLIDSDGKIRYRARGNPGWDETETLSVIRTMMP